MPLLGDSASDFPPESISLGMRIGERIRELRVSRGYKQEYLAEVAGVSQGKISRIEGGESQPTFAEMVAIARALECRLDDFADDDAEGKAPKASAAR